MHSVFSSRYRVPDIIPGFRLGFRSATGLRISLAAALSALVIANIVRAQNEVSQPSGQSPAALVEAMSMAVKTLNYEGTFVHVSGVRVTSMHILHSFENGTERERLLSLDGEARELIRNDEMVTCIWPASQSVMMTKAKPRDLLPQVQKVLTDVDRYEFSMGEPDRVAGLKTHVINIDPVDTYRYGYRFWIDQETNMLLRSMMVDGSNNMMEQVLFTDIEFPDSIAANRFNAVNEGEQLSWLEPKQATARSGVPKILERAGDRVSFSKLPEGYREVSESYAPMPSSDIPVSHVMLTDGMASVSVYVEYLQPSEQNQATVGLSTMGVMNAFGISMPTAFVTAVGEVPADTVKAIAGAVLLDE